MNLFQLLDESVSTIQLVKYERIKYKAMNF
jgi:hypothetical protein